MWIRRLLFWFPFAGMILLGLCQLPRALDYLAIRSFSAPVRQACLSGQDRLALRDIASFDWDEVVILGPYVSRPRAAASLGYPWPEYLDHQMLWTSDRYAALLFLKADRIVETRLHWREYGDFPYPMRRISREDAVFHIKPVGTDCAFAQLTLTAAP